EQPQVIQRFSAKAVCGPAYINATNLPSGLDRAPKNFELGLGRPVADIHDFKAVAKVGLVRSIAEHCVGILYSLQGQRDLDAEAAAENLSCQPLDHAEHIIHLDK